MVPPGKLRGVVIVIVAVVLLALVAVRRLAQSCPEA